MSLFADYEEAPPWVDPPEPKVKVVLSPDQQAARQAFTGFIMHPEDRVMVIGGYAGTGKSTLVDTLLNELPTLLKTARLITQKEHDWTVQVTATTNKACEALMKLINMEVRTIQSFLGLRVVTDHKTRTTHLEPHGAADVQENIILFIDEASYVDEDLLEWIAKMTNNCKIIFIGDPAQLTPVKTNYAPVFCKGYPEAKLEKVVRQAEGNPIIELATAFRETVSTGVWPAIQLDGHHIQWLHRPDFEDAIIKEFQDSRHDAGKVLAWTNKTVIAFNHAIREIVQGVPDLEVGDYAVCNKFVGNGRTCNVKTDQTVLITQIKPATTFGVGGWNIQMDKKHTAFMPASLDAKCAVLRKLRQDEEWDKVRKVEDHWLDLRAAYSCTINKSQGSTYDKVFIDLDDIKRCHSGNSIARMMYVGVSRARHHVIMTGDLV